MKLHNYQERAINFLKEQSRALLSIDMGLGKTAAVLNYLNDTRPTSVIIIAPKRVAETVWLQEAIKWDLPYISDRMTIISGTPAKRHKALNDTSKPYKIIGRDNLKDIEHYQTDILIIDELTSFKTCDSSRSEYVRTIKAQRYIGLTGTFIANGIIDIYGQLAALNITKASIRYSKNSKYKWCPEFQAWRGEHFKDVLQGRGLSFEKWRPLISMDEILKPFEKHIFTLDAADYLNIPDVSYIEHPIELSPAEYHNYLRLSSILSVDLNGEILAINEEAKFVKLQTLCNGFIYDKDSIPHRGKSSIKLNAVADFCASAIAEGEQILLFYAYKEEALWLSEMFTKHKLRYCSTNDKAFLNKWNNNDIDILIAHPASAGHGLNLQYAGRICVWSSITYNFEYWAQANARLARQGQTKKVQIHVFSTKDTIESKQFKAIKTKESENEDFKLLTKQ